MDDQQAKHWRWVHQNGSLKGMQNRIAGTVRLPETIRAEVVAYADEWGLTYNGAMNVLVRAGLKAEKRRTR